MCRAASAAVRRRVRIAPLLCAVRRGSASARGSAKQYLTNYGWHHSAVVPRLSGGTTYYYRVGDGAAAWSDVLHFVAPRVAADEAVTLSVFGDMGYMNSTVRPMQVRRLR